MVSSQILLRSLRVYILKQLFFSISVNSGFRNITSPRITLTVGVVIHVTRQRWNDSIIGLKWPCWTRLLQQILRQEQFKTVFHLLWVYTSEGTKFCPTRNFKVDRGKSMNTHANIFIFNRFCKALASLVIIFPKKLLQESVDHPSNIQPPAAESIWRFRTWLNVCFFIHYIYWSKLCAFDIKLFRTQRTEHYLLKSF